MVRVAGEMERQGLRHPVARRWRHDVAPTRRIDGQYPAPRRLGQDASRSVPSVSQLLNPGATRDPHGRCQAGVRRDACPARHRQGDRAATGLAELEAARANAQVVDFTATPHRRRSALASSSCSTTQLADLRRFIDWTPLLRRLGDHGRYPDVPRSPPWVRPRASSRGRPGDARQGDRREAAHRQWRRGDPARETRWVTTSRCMPRGPIERSCPPSTACGNRGEHRAGVPNRASRTMWPRATQGVSTMSAPSPSRPVWAPRTASWPSRRTTTTTQRSCSGDRRPARRSLCRAAAPPGAHRVLGYSPDGDLDNEALIKEQYAGFGPRPGYPACPDHGEVDPLRPARRDRARGHRTHRVDGDVAGAAVSGRYLAHPDGQYFVVGPRRA